ncbi:NmrA/HSCARG family protein [Alsobacter sp. SYSU M60028]|uniref:NmrA/HSCARG family protein n=1 Tax=Alsobacter ponti TaxID=2962936 RepID=A0ABT1LA42_9HYPH|nr:NmrA/HSCARG family protein [Alsobacter ponti]MCP8937610.1 NmrA/HSCARG family protein [Alsobacter ponti]
MPQRKIIAVIGATGAQGGGLARAILDDKDGPFALRAITRNPGSDNARALAAAGAEVVAADADDPPSLDRAFAGAYGAFCVTNFWEHFSPARELKQAEAMAHAARKAGVAHVVWSTLEDTRRRVPLSDARLPTLQGTYKVPHFDAKGEADAFFAGLPTTYLLAAFYWDNFIFFGMGPRKGEGDALNVVLPLGGGRLPGIAAVDIGRCCHGVFGRGSDMIGRRVGLAGDILTGEQMAAAFTRALGRQVNFVDLPFDTYRGLGFPGADDLGNMFHYQALFNEEFCKSRDVSLSRELNPRLQSFAAWLAANKDRIPIQ